MKVSLKKAFSLLDGRLSTEIGDVYEMLNFIFSDNLFTHQIPEGMRTIKRENPDWYRIGVEYIEHIKTTHHTNDFTELMKIIDSINPPFEIELTKLHNKIDFMKGFEKLVGE